MAKLRSLLVNFVAEAVSLRAGNVGLKSWSFFIGRFELGAFDKNSYSRIPATVELSKVPRPVTYGLAVIRKVAFGNFGFVFKRRFVVWPGDMRMVSVSKGLT